MTRIEAGRNGEVIVTGLSIAEVRAKIIPRPPGRPHRTTLIAEDAIRAAVVELEIRDFPVDALFLADMVGCSRRELRDAIRALWGSWAGMRRDQKPGAFPASGPRDDADHEAD
jgi:hypothetical protein